MGGEARRTLCTGLLALGGEWPCPVAAMATGVLVSADTVDAESTLP